MPTDNKGMVYSSTSKYTINKGRARNISIKNNSSRILNSEFKGILKKIEIGSHHFKFQDFRFIIFERSNLEKTLEAPRSIFLNSD